MARDVSHVEDYDFTSGDEVFFYTNVWLFIYGPHDPRTRECTRIRRPPRLPSLGAGVRSHAYRPGVQHHTRHLSAAHTQGKGVIRSATHRGVAVVDDATGVAEATGALTSDRLRLFYIMSVGRNKGHSAGKSTLSMWTAPPQCARIRP